MIEQEFFPQRPSAAPSIYAFRLNDVASHNGYIKVGYTDRDVKTRIREIMHTSGVPYTICGRIRRCVPTVHALPTTMFTLYSAETDFTGSMKARTITSGTAAPLMM